MAETAVQVRFWGARGSIPTPGPDTFRYGGNTSCLEIRCGDHLLIFDGGSGLRLLGNDILGRKVPMDADLFLSHCHIDHLIGLPFFAPAFEKDSHLRIWAGNAAEIGGVKNAIAKLMSYPLFPVELDMFKGKVEFSDFKAGDVLKPRAGIAVQTAALNHPGGAIGYRVDYEGRVIAYVTDTELTGGTNDGSVLKLVRNADLLIIDATYTDAELPDHIGWGHSSWQQTVKLANEAGVKQLCLYHHDPEHDDTAMDDIAAAVEKERAGTVVAREGMILTL